MGNVIPLKQLGPIAGTYKRQERHDCHCGSLYLPDRDGSCQWCGRFPRQVIAELNEDRKHARRRKGKR